MWQRVVCVARSSDRAGRANSFKHGALGFAGIRPRPVRQWSGKLSSLSDERGVFLRVDHRADLCGRVGRDAHLSELEKGLPVGRSRHRGTRPLRLSRGRPRAASLRGSMPDVGYAADSVIDTPVAV